MKRHQRSYNVSDNRDTVSESESDTELHCLSCLKEYTPHDVGICKECYDGADKVQDELMEEINLLMAKVDFLRLSSSPLDGGNLRSFTDVVLIAYENGVASPPVLAHKAVLVNRSPVFKAMLENEMEESRSGTIKISDVTYGILGNFVNYLYTAEVCGLDGKMAFDLLVMSEKYQVKHLKSYCEKFLITSLSPEKALVYYAFAHQYNAKRLHRAALFLIIEHMEQLTKGEEYTDLVKKHPCLVIEIYEAYIFKKFKETARGPSSSKAKLGEKNLSVI